MKPADIDLHCFQGMVHARIQKVLSEGVQKVLSEGVQL